MIDDSILVSLTNFMFTCIT